MQLRQLKFTIKELKKGVVATQSGVVVCHPLNSLKHPQERRTWNLQENKILDFCSASLISFSLRNLLYVSITSGPVLALALAGRDAVQHWRSMLGPADLSQAQEEEPDWYCQSDEPPLTIHKQTHTHTHTPNRETQTPAQCSEVRHYLNRIYSPMVYYSVIVSVILSACTLLVFIY